MGGHEKWRNFLCLLLARHFHSVLPEGTAFDILLYDLMALLAPLVLDKKHEQFDSDRVARRCADSVAHYQNREQDPSRPIVTRSVVVMLDTPQWVPKNKAATQRTRDRQSKNTATSTSEEEEEEEAPPGSHMDEAAYNRLVAQRGGDTDSLFIDHGQAPLPGFTGAMVWRSETLKFQLCRLVAMQCMQLPVPDLQTLVFDDGVAISTRRFAEVRRLMIQHNDWSQRPAFERECLVHQTMIQQELYHQRLVLYDDRQFHRFPGSHVGEADIKIQAYLRPHNGAYTTLVVNQDTDVLFVLLLHMQWYLDGFAAEEQERVEVWLDTRSPTSRDPPTPYRYIDVKRLYLDLVALMRHEFPGVLQPLETFCFLVFSLRTDFTRPFAACLGVGARQVWDTFSELHSSGTEGHLQFATRLGTEVTRSQHRQCPNELRDLLAGAVRYDVVQQRFELHQEPIARFYYYLCQHKVMRARQRLRMPALDVKAALRPHELLLYARELQERLDNYKGQRPGGLEREETTPQQMFDAPWFSAAPSQSELASFVTQNEKALQALTKRPTPPAYGVPTPQQMATRISRLGWYLKYCRHGWQSTEHAYDCCAFKSPEAPLYGWKKVVSREFNSSYCENRLVDGQLQCYATVECDKT